MRITRYRIPIVISAHTLSSEKNAISEQQYNQIYIIDKYTSEGLLGIGTNLGMFQAVQYNYHETAWKFIQKNN
jgi:hypothetical protein